jgi:hypothetical protein
VAGRWDGKAAKRACACRAVVAVAHDAVASALGSTYLVAGIAGVAGAALVLELMRQRRDAPVGEPSPVSETPSTDGVA